MIRQTHKKTFAIIGSLPLYNQTCINGHLCDREKNDRVRHDRWPFI